MSNFVLLVAYAYYPNIQKKAARGLGIWDGLLTFPIVFMKSARFLFNGTDLFNNYSCSGIHSPVGNIKLAHTHKTSFFMFYFLFFLTVYLDKSTEQ